MLLNKILSINNIRLLDLRLLPKNNGYCCLTLLVLLFIGRV
jgi:hypothetical protein